MTYIKSNEEINLKSLLLAIKTDTDIAVRKIDNGIQVDIKGFKGHINCLLDLFDDQYRELMNARELINGGVK